MQWRGSGFVVLSWWYLVAGLAAVGVLVIAFLDVRWGGRIMAGGVLHRRPDPARGAAVAQGGRPQRALAHPRRRHPADPRDRGAHRLGHRQRPGRRARPHVRRPQRAAERHVRDERPAAGVRALPPDPLQRGLLARGPGAGGVAALPARFLRRRLLVVGAQPAGRGLHLARALRRPLQRRLPRRRRGARRGRLHPGLDATSSGARRSSAARSRSRSPVGVGAALAADDPPRQRRRASPATSWRPCSASSRRRTGLFVDFPRGIQIDRSGATYRYDQLSSPFLTLVERRQPGAPPSTVYAARHARARQWGPVREVSAPPDVGAGHPRHQPAQHDGRCACLAARRQRALRPRARLRPRRVRPEPVAAEGRSSRRLVRLWVQHPGEVTKWAEAKYWRLRGTHVRPRARRPR